MLNDYKIAESSKDKIEQSVEIFGESFTFRKKIIELGENKMLDRCFSAVYTILAFSLLVGLNTLVWTYFELREANFQLDKFNDQFRFSNFDEKLTQKVRLNLIMRFVTLFRTAKTRRKTSMNNMPSCMNNLNSVR